MENVLFTIGIITVDDRKRYLDRLLARLEDQRLKLPNPGAVQVLVDGSHGPTRGFKRRQLVERANGKYMAFIDDDDLVANSYLSRIVSIISSNPGLDCIGFEGRLFHSQGGYDRFYHSIRYTHWYTDNAGHCRNPNHLNPIRRDICLAHPYADMHSGEDHNFSMQLSSSGALSKEVYISEEPMYYYYPGGWNAPL